MLHPVRGGIADVPGDRPAVLPRQFCQQAQHERRARRRGSTRANRPAIRPISSSNSTSQRATSRLCPAATARSSRVVTNRDDQRWPSHVQHN
jgi:hypothetical protein